MDIPLVSSRIDSVTAYRKGARVHRVADLRAAGGAFPEQIKLTHLPLAMDDASLKVRVSGASGAVPIASDLRVTLEVPPPDPALAPAEDAELRAARNETAKLRDRLEQNHSETARLEAIVLPPRAKEKDAKSPIPVPTDARVKLLEFRLERMEALLKERESLGVELTEANRKLLDLEAKNAKASSARQPREHELRKAVVVSLRSSANGTPVKLSETAQFELEYLIPGARWAPAYTFRFDRDYTKAEISMRALVAQKTGEDWSGVKLVLSTANAQGWTELDELSSLRIGRRQPPVVKKGWRPPPQGAGELYADYDRAIKHEPKRCDTVILSPSETGAASVAAISLSHLTPGTIVTARDAMDHLGITANELQTLIARGDLRALRHNNQMMFKADDIASLQSEKGTEPTIIIPTSGAKKTGGSGMLPSVGGSPPGGIGQIVLEDIELMPTDDAAGTQQVTIQVDENLRYRRVASAAAPAPPAAAPGGIRPEGFGMAPAQPAMSRVLRAAAAPGSPVGATAHMLASRVMKPESAPETADLSSDTTILHREMSPSEQMLNYGRLRMPPATAHGRGKLELLSEDLLYFEISTQLDVNFSFCYGTRLKAVHHAQALENRSPPHRCRYPETVGGFDYAYATPAPVDIPSDGEFHSIPLFCETADARANFVCVPREVLDVFRFAEIKNPLGAPLLEGPADIHAGGDFLMTTVLNTVPAYGQIRLGLGVEQSIKAARNTSYSEDAAGIIGGSLDLKHELKIDLVSHLSQPVQIEVRERIPVLREGEDQAKLSVAQVTPEWEALKPESLRPGEESLLGGYRWVVSVEPGKPRQLKAMYVVQISAKNELSGGNRREA